MLNRCKDAIKTNQEKQNEVVKHRDDLIQQLNEKQTVIESMMKVIFFLFYSLFFYIINSFSHYLNIWKKRKEKIRLYLQKIRRYILLGKFKRRRSFQFEAFCKKYFGEWILT